MHTTRNEPQRVWTENMDNETIKNSVAIYAAVLSTLLGGIKLWETFWKDRIRLATTYSFSSQEGAVDEITIVNLSNVPVQVSHWELGWKPRLFKRGKPARDVTPDDMSMFKIAPKDSHTLYFEDADKFDWSYRIAEGRQLWLTLYLFGRKRPKVLNVHAGQ